MAVLYSSPVTVIRYTNGTMVRLTASSHEFVSYDYDPETQSGSFLPQTITVTATLSGHLTLKEWQYMTSGGSYQKLENIQGATVSGNTVTIVPTSKLFETSNSVTIRALGSDDTHDDTVTISKIVDPMYVYDRTHTSIEQTNDKISLIASEEQLAQLSTEETFIDKYSAFEQTASGFQQTVQATYATKTYADNSASTAASGAVTTANAYADGKLQDYPTKLEVSSAIQQSATSITSTVSENYSTKQQTLVTAQQEAGKAQTAAIDAAESYTDGQLEDYATIDYADDVAGNAQTGAQDYTDLQLRNYLTTAETQSRIEQKAGEITQTVEATYATKEELTSATDGTYTLETPYFYEDQTYSFEAKIYKNSEDITESLPEDHIMWSVRSEEYFDEEVIGTGKTATIHEDKIGYGGTVVCHMVVTSDEFPLTTEEDYNLTDEYGQALTIVYALSELTTETTLYRKDYLKNQFAQLRVTMDGITAEVRSQESKFGQALTEQWSRTEQRAEGIETEVGKKVGTDEIISRINQSPEAVSIQARKINLQGAVTADCIATGAVTAEKIDVDDLFSQNITATGTITGLNLVGAIVEADEGYIGNWVIDENGYLRNEYGNIFMSPTIETAEKFGYEEGVYFNVNGFMIDGNGDSYAGKSYNSAYYIYARSGMPWTGMTVKDLYLPVIWSDTWREGIGYNYYICVGDSSSDPACYIRFESGEAFLCVGSYEYNMETYFQYVDDVNSWITTTEEHIGDIDDSISDYGERIETLENTTPTYPYDINCTTLNATGAISGKSLSITNGIDCTEIDATGHIQTSGNVKGGEVYTNTGTAVESAANAIITSSGRIAPKSSSSKRYKDDKGYVLAEDAKVVLDIPVVKFSYKEGYLDEDDEMVGVTMPGFYAEDVERLIPEAVYHKDGEVENWKERIILPLLLKVVQEQQNEIDELKTLVREALKNAN